MLTREQIENMDASPEMDAAMAEFVMGWPIVYMGNPDSDEWWTRVPSYPCLVVHQDGSNWCVRSDGPEDPLGSFDPSTDIAAAMEAVEKVEPQRVVSIRRISGDWLVAIAVSACKVVDTKAHDIEVAICRALLLGKLEREESTRP